MHGADDDADLLDQFAAQRLLDRLTRLDLAAGEFPVTGVDLAGRTGGEQEAAVRPPQHADRDRHFLAIGSAFARPLAVGDQHAHQPGCRPAQSRANW